MEPTFTSLICLLGGIMVAVVIMLASAMRIVPEHQRLAVYRLGRFIGEQGPGIVLLIPIIDRGILRDVSEDMTKAKTYQQNMFGIIGITKTPVHNDGEVEIDGETWAAISAEPIPPGTRVRLKKIILEIETF